MTKNKVLEIPSLLPHLPDYRIVFEKQESSAQRQTLSSEQEQLFTSLYTQVQEDAAKHIGALVTLYKQAPHVPEIANLLTYAYLRLKNKREAEELIEKTYRDHPDYLLAKINYADQCLRLSKPGMIPEIFQGKWELAALYPERKHFHYTEFRGFQVVMGFYYLEMGEKNKAIECYELAFQVDPLHPSVTALERKLFKTSLLKKCFKVLQRLAGISKNP
jgi:tetratricopeptide (TPR) repeat protein